nr:MAG TPA: hypothetical protein [Herelleviridae sp.]
MNVTNTISLGKPIHAHSCCSGDTRQSFSVLHNIHLLARRGRSRRRRGWFCLRHMCVLM